MLFSEESSVLACTCRPVIYM